MDSLSSHLSAPELAGHAARRLAAADVLRVSDHLAGCADCREAFARARPPAPMHLGEFLEEPQGETPTFAELDAALAGRLTPGQQERLAASPAAREALADLAAFRDELAKLPVKFHGPGQPPGWRRRAAPAWAAGLAAVLLALAAGWWMFARPAGETAVLLSDAGGRPADLAGLPADLRKSVETALRTGVLPPMASILAPEGGTLAGETARPLMTAVFPVGTVVRETRPTLRWTPHAEATAYTVYVTPADGGPVLASPELPATQTAWTPPGGLNPGETYEWQVDASRNGKTIDRAPKPPAGEARFEVLDAGRAADLSRLEKQAAGYPLILGVAYWRAGLAGAAAEQFHRLAREHAQSSVARELERAAAHPNGAE